MIRRFLTSRWSAVAMAITVLSAGHLWPLGLVALTPTISLVELEWSVAALIGILYSGDFIRQCWLDGLAAADDEASRLTVESFVLIGVVLLGLHVILLTFGVLAMRGAATATATSAGVRLLEVVLTVLGEQLVLALMVIRAKRARVLELAAAATT